MPVFRNTTLLEYCLAHLVENLPDDAELIVVDDASGPDTIDFVSRVPRVRLVRHDTNRGNTVSYNTGARAAAGDILLFVDSDVFVPPGAISQLTAPLASDDSVGIVGSLLLYPYDCTIQHAGVAFDRWTLSHLFVGGSVNELSFAPLEERQAVTAAFMATRRRLFDDIGGFDTTYRDGLEDIEYCLACRHRGYRTLLATSLPAIHLESATRGPYKNIRRTFNYSVFFSRWSNQFEPDLERYSSQRSAAVLRDYSSHYPAPILNFCTTPNWMDLAGVLARPGLELGSAHDVSGTIAESDPIDLFRTVPAAFQRLPYAVVFVVDHFTQLARNQWWFKQRLAEDVIIDRHANVVTSARLGWDTPGQQR
jgi:GT2 family glycosyltransferase